MCSQHLLTRRCRSEATGDDFDLCFLKKLAFKSLFGISEAGSAALHPKTPPGVVAVQSRSETANPQEMLERRCKMQNVPPQLFLPERLCRAHREDFLRVFSFILCFRLGLFSKASSRKATKRSRPRGRRGFAAP